MIFFCNISPQVVATEKGKKPPLFQKIFPSSSSHLEQLFYKAVEKNLSPQLVAIENGKKPPLFQNFLSSISSH
jgi:hypothetical protein